MLSIIIPARNEEFLERTIANVLSSAGGDVEILVMLDGWLPDPPIDTKDQRVVFLTYNESVGQRAATNEGVRRAKGKYIMKLDAHCMLDEGFDVKLAKDCEHDWTVIPRMYNLHVFNWICECGEKWYQADRPDKCDKCGRAITERKMIWEPLWYKQTDFTYFDKDLRFQYWNKYRKRPESKGDIVDVMGCLGACFFMEKSRYEEIEGLDERHGSWGQVGTEIACKSWLSGGRMVVNKKTWFSHMFRTNNTLTFPYSQNPADQEIARAYSRDLWLNNKWPKQIRNLDWLVKKFDPPTWNGYLLTEEDRQSIPYEKQEQISVRSQQSYIIGLTLPVNDLWRNHWAYCDPRKIDSYKVFLETFREYIGMVANGEEFTDEQLEKLSYYDYLITKLNPVDRDPLTDKGKRHVLNLMKDGAKVYQSIKKNGLMNPLDFWREPNGRITLHRGGRRLEILHLLEYKTVPVRIFKTKEIFRRYGPSPGVIEDDSIHALGMKQFAKLQEKATDKFWVHDYLRLYDRHIGHLRQKKKTKILEIGVFRGASLLLWKEAFPKAQIFGVDKNTRIWQEFLADQGRIQVFVGYQEDKDFMERQVIPSGPFDVVIDDGGHEPDTQMRTFNMLWGSLEKGGIYIVEDIWRNYRGVKPKETIPDIAKRLMDEAQVGIDIKSVNVYYNICFFEKT